jgi:hypothetical protein
MLRRPPYVVQQHTRRDVDPAVINSCYSSLVTVEISDVIWVSDSLESVVLILWYLFLMLRGVCSVFLRNLFPTGIRTSDSPARSHVTIGGGAVGWGTALQAGRSRFRFPMVSLEFLIDITSCNALSQYLHRTREKTGKSWVELDLSTRRSVWEEPGNHRGISFLSCLVD